MKIRAFAVDVDGTITEDGGRIDLEAAFVLRWLEKLGYNVILVSGRSVWEVYSLAVYLGITRVVVAENGGVVAKSPVDIALLGDKYLGLTAYEKLSSENMDLKLKPVPFRFTEVVLERTFDLDEAQSILNEAGIPVQINDSKYAYHLTNRGVSKGEGLKRALGLLKIDPSHTVAIGDSDTDIDMFNACGYAIALENAPETTKARANHCTKTGMGKGLVEAVEHVVDRFLKVTYQGG